MSGLIGKISSRNKIVNEPLTDGGILLGSGAEAITATAVLADGEMLVGDASGDPAIESGGTLRTSIGLGNVDNIADASQTALGTISSGTWEGTTVAVDQGGTGATSLTDGGILLGSGTSAITALAALADGAMIVGDGTTDPVSESGATLRTSIGVGTGDSPTFAGITVSDAISSMGTVAKFLYTTSDGGLGRIFTKKGYVTATTPTQVYTPANKELGIIFVWEELDATAMACSMYSGNYPEVYALQLLSLGANGGSIDPDGTAISVNMAAAFNWVVIAMSNKYS